MLTELPQTWPQFVKSPDAQIFWYLMLSKSGANPLELLQIIIKSEFYNFSKMNLMKQFLVELLMGNTLKIQVKCYE